MGLDRSKLSVDQLAQLEQYEANKKQLEALEGIGKKLQSVVVAIQAQQSKGEKGTGDLGTLLMDIRESLDELKDKEDPEQPDFSKPVVDALSKLEKAITASVKGIDVKPQVNVDAKTPEVDLSGVEKVLGTLPKAFDKAVKSIPKVDVPETDFKPLVDKLDELGKQLADIDTGVRMKPQPGTMKVTNPDGTEVGSQLLSKDRFAMGTITTRNVSTLWKATGNSAVVLPVEGPYSVLAIQTTGTYTGALTVQSSVDGLTWVSYAGSQILNMNTGLYLATITSALQSTFQVDISRMKYVRVTALAAVTGSVRVTMAASEADSPRGALGVLTTVTTVATLTNITNWGNVVDNGAFVDGTTRLMPGGYIYDEVAGTALSENDAAAARIDAKRAQIGVIEDASTRGQRATVSAAGALKVDTSGVTMPTTLVSFVTDIPTAGTRVQLGSNTMTNGFIIQAPSTNTGVIYVGGSTVSSTVYGAELQAGQSTSVMIDNTNKIYVDTDVSGSDVAVIGT